MCQAGAVMVAGGGEKDLRLVLEPPEGLAVDDPIAVVLKRRSNVVFGLGTDPPAGGGAPGRLWRKRLEFALLERFTNAGQRGPRGSWCHVPGGQRERSPPASAPGRQRCAGCRDRRHSELAAPTPEAARTRGNDRCSALTDRCRGRR